MSSDWEVKFKPDWIKHVEEEKYIRERRKRELNERIVFGILSIIISLLGVLLYLLK